MHYTFNLTEELARWAFEVYLNKKPSHWHIAFTNPTAGPWKRIMCSNGDGDLGEVHRFEREEERPDLVITSDKHKKVIIFEAKDFISKLLGKNQIKKSADVVNRLAAKLQKKDNNLFWGQRSQYKYFCGLLWGSASPIDSEEAQRLFKAYAPYISNAHCSDVIVGVEATRGEQRVDISLNFHVSENESFESINLSELFPLEH